MRENQHQAVISFRLLPLHLTSYPWAWHCDHRITADGLIKDHRRITADGLIKDHRRITADGLIKDHRRITADGLIKLLNVNS